MASAILEGRQGEDVVVEQDAPAEPAAKYAEPQDAPVAEPSLG
jgi:hypothetical protein